MDSPVVDYACTRIGGYVNSCVNLIRQRPTLPLPQGRYHPRIGRRGRTEVSVMKARVAMELIETVKHSQGDDHIAE